MLKSAQAWEENHLASIQQSQRPYSSLFLTLMASVQIYLKPRPVSPVYGHSNYLPFKCPSDFEYGPFFADYGTIPSDAAEVYTLQSSALATSLSTFYSQLIPSLDAEVPDPNKFRRSTWSGLLQRVGLFVLFPARD